MSAGGGRMMTGIALLAAGIFAASMAHAIEQPEVSITWNAPAGAEGAKSDLEPACGDTTRADTLYLNFRLAEDHPAFSGTTAIIMFHTSFGDTLTPFWKTIEYPDKPTHVRVEFPSDTGNASFRAAAAVSGFGDFAYYTEPDKAIVRMIYAVPSIAAPPIAGGRDYCMARIIISHSADRPGCDVPMCVEFFDSEFKFSLNQPMVKGQQTYASFASMNSKSGVVCAPHRLNARQRKVVKLPPLPRNKPPGIGTPR